MSIDKLKKLEVGKIVVFKRGSWRSSQLVAKAEITDLPTKHAVPIRIVEILSSDIFWLQYQVGRKLNATLNEISLE